jgi:hypothetical protein
MRIALGLFTAAILFAQAAGGLKWAAPSSWKTLPQRPMRAATYSVPPAAADKEAGEVAVFYFGAGQGGSVDANIKRWIGQFETKQQAKTAKKTVNGLPVTTIDLSGTYLASAGPMGGPTTRKPGYRLLGAIVEGPQGAVFFKFTAPEKTAAANQAAFDKMIASVKK